MIKPFQGNVAASVSFLLPACLQEHSWAQHSPPPLLHPGCRALWVDWTGLDSAEPWKSWKPWLESKRGAEQPAACPALPSLSIIDRYPVALDSPSSNLGCHCPCSHRGETREHHFFSSSCSDLGIFIPWATSPSQPVSPSWPQRKWLDRSKQCAFSF